MKKDLTMQMNHNTTLVDFKKVSNTIAKKSEGIVERIAKYYSGILEEEVSPRKAKLMINSQLAFLSVLLTSGGPLLICGACVLWFGSSLLKFKGEK